MNESISVMNTKIDVREFIKKKVVQLQQKYVAPLIDRDVVRKLKENRELNSAALSSVTITIRSVEFIEKIEKHHKQLMNLRHTDDVELHCTNHANRSGSHGRSAHGQRTPPVKLERTYGSAGGSVTIGSSMPLSGSAKTNHKEYYSQMYKQIKNDLGMIPPPIHIHRHIPELMGSLW